MHQQHAFCSLCQRNSWLSWRTTSFLNVHSSPFMNMLTLNQIVLRGDPEIASSVHGYHDCISYLHWLCKLCRLLSIQTFYCSLWVSFVLAAYTFCILSQCLILTQPGLLSQPFKVWYCKLICQKEPKYFFIAPPTSSKAEHSSSCNFYSSNLKQTEHITYTAVSWTEVNCSWPKQSTPWQIARLLGKCITHPTNQISHLQQGQRLLLSTFHTVCGSNSESDHKST